MLGQLIGKALALPLRVVALPLDVLERVTDDAAGVNTPKRDRITTGILHTAADEIEERTKDALGDRD